jgi:hypothetical protein
MAKAGLARVGRGLGWRSLVAGSALALAGAVAVAAAPSAGAAGAGAGAAGAGAGAAGSSAAAGAGAAGALPASGSACGKAVGPFSVSGTWVLRADGEPFISYGLRNLFWIEGPESSASFAGMVQQHAVLNVSGVVYALHHPAGQADTASWDADFGYLVTTGVAPVVDGEWTNLEPAPTAYPTAPRTSCWPGAPNEVPQFLQYLAEYGIGMNAYQLQPGYLIRSYSNLAGPTTMNAKTWTCQSNQETQPGQGAGSQVLAWFRKQNG